MFNDRPEYQIWALKLNKTHHVSLLTIKLIKEWAQNHHQDIHLLEYQDILPYNTLIKVEGLLDEMQGLDKLRFIKSCIAEFNTIQRVMLKNGILDGLGTDGRALNRLICINEWHDIFTKFKQLEQNKQEKIIVTASAIKDDFDFLKNFIERSLSDSYEWERESLLSFLQNKCTDCKIVFDENNVVMVTVPSFASSEALCGSGRTTWCLSREEHFFKDYVVNKNRTQYFIFDFNKPECDNLSHIGLTVDFNEGITHAHSTQNSSLMGSHIYNIIDDLKIPQTIFNKLKELSNYEWTLRSLLKFLGDENIKIHYNKDGIVIVKIDNTTNIEKLIGHTKIYITSCNFNPYIVFNLNVPFNDDDAIHLMYYENSEYNDEIFHSGYNTFNKPIALNDVITKFNIMENDYLKSVPLSPNVQLHKMVKYGQIKEAIKYIKTNNDIDVNYCHNLTRTITIFNILATRNEELIKTAIEHNSFNCNIKNVIGETVLTQLLYEYMGTDEDNYDVQRQLRSLIEKIINLPNIDLNIRNINLSNALCVASESIRTNWAVLALLQKNSVNVNNVDDDNMTPLSYAIVHRDIEVIYRLLLCKELIIRPKDISLAGHYDINLKSMMGAVYYMS